MKTTTTTRRSFGLRVLGLSSSLLVLPALECNEGAGDLLASLRGVVKSVETALGALGILQGLLPDVVNQSAKYLLAVLKFVDDVAVLLENETVAAVDKANQILQWGAALLTPSLPAPVGAILQGVAAALDAFLQHFGGRAGQPAPRVATNVPNVKLSQGDKAMLAAIEASATADTLRVEQWAHKAGGASS